MANVVPQAVETPSDVNNTSSTPAPMASYSYTNRARVAVTGGVVTAVGLVLIPAPVPVGCIVTAYGLSILATEFDGAQDALENGKKALENGIEWTANAIKREDKKEEDGGEEGSDNLPAEEEGLEQVLDEDGSEEGVTAMVVRTPATEKVPPDMNEIVLRQSFRGIASQVLERHSYNMRHVTSYFLREVLLKALRDLKVPRPPRPQEEVDENNGTATAPATNEENKTTASDDSTSSDEDSAPDAASTDTSDSSSHSIDNDEVEVSAVEVVDVLPACIVTEAQLDKEPVDKVSDETVDVAVEPVHVEC